VETKDKWLEEKRKRIDGYFKEIERLEEEKKRVTIIIDTVELLK
jgi:C4-type Zn-finger protein